MTFSYNCRIVFKIELISFKPLHLPYLSKCSYEKCFAKLCNSSLRNILLVIFFYNYIVNTQYWFQDFTIMSAALSGMSLISSSSTSSYTSPLPHPPCVIHIILSYNTPRTFHHRYIPDYRKKTVTLQLTSANYNIQLCNVLSHVLSITIIISHTNHISLRPSNVNADV